MDLHFVTSSSLFWLISAGFITFVLSASSKHSTGLPRVGKDPGLFSLKIWLARIDFIRRGLSLVYERYQNNKNSNYVIQTMMDDQVVLGPKYLSELRMLPETSLNASAALVDSVLGRYSGVDILLKDHLGSDVCRVQLTKNLSKMIPQMSDELSLATSEVFRGCQDGVTASYVAYKAVYALISSMSSRVFIGAPTCRDKEWTDSVNSFPKNVEKIKIVLLFIPSFVRSWFVYLLPMKWHLIRNHRRVRDLLFPSSPIEKSKEEHTVLNYLLQASKDHDPEDLTSKMILLTAAAFHNSSTAALQAIYNLCAMPEYSQALRNEAEQALRQTAGAWTLDTLNNLHRLDSFLKESQRLDALGFLGFNRKVMSEIKLSDGTCIPPGQTIKIPSGPMARDETYYDGPTNFDGDRFYRQMSKGQKEGAKQYHHEYAEIEPGNLTWGNGRFSCPGRWYASAMLKLLLATLLLEYDFELTGFHSGRPENIV